MAEFKRGTGVDHKFGWSGTVATGNVRQRDGRILVSRPQDSPLWADPTLLTETARPTWRGNHATGTRDSMGGIAITHDDGTSVYLQPGDDAGYLADALDGADARNIDVLLCDQLEGLEPGTVGA